MAKIRKCQIMRRLSYRLPIVGPIVDGLYNPDVTVPLLALPNTALARSVLGNECVLKQEDDLVVCTNNDSIRYLRVASSDIRPSGQLVSQRAWHNEISLGFLLLKLDQRERPFVDNIYVDEAYRHQGIASRLLEAAILNFPDLCLDGRFTKDGLIFFGAEHRKR
jgi:hypothetical protein